MDLAGALYRLYLREDNPAVFESLVGALEDPEQRVRSGAAAAIGNLRKPEGVSPLLRQLEVESDSGVQGEILTALEFMCLEGSETRMSLFSGVQIDILTRTLVRMRSSDVTGALPKAVLEWLEVLAEERSKEARQRYLEADVEGAESLLLSALELVPSSVNINQKLGRLYYDSGQRERGLRYLEEHGMVARAVELPATPEIDGNLDEAAWAGAEPLTEFYQCIFLMSAVPAEGRAEGYIGYRDQTLYVLVKGYKPGTEGLVANVTQRDSDVYRDDCVEIFLDTNHDSQGFFHYIINTIPTVVDDDEGPGSEGGRGIPTSASARRWPTRSG